jgi:hypothetical protein
MTIKGKIAEVIPPHDIALNIGSDAGVGEGDEVTVHETISVLDPDSQAELGRVEYERGSFKVLLVAPAFSIATIDDYMPSTNPTTSISYSTVFAYSPPPRKQVVRRGQDVPDRMVGAVMVAVGDDVRVEKPKAAEIKSGDELNAPASTADGEPEGTPPDPRKSGRRNNPHRRPRSPD